MNAISLLLALTVIASAHDPAQGAEEVAGAEMQAGFKT
jgi:hypothetical protein